MTSIQDRKLSFFGNGAFSNVGDAEFDWLGDQGATGSTIQDRWSTYLTSLGYTVGSIQDRLYQYLISQGYSGSFPDAYNGFLAGVVTPYSGFLSLEGDFSGFLSLEGDFSGSLSLEGNE